jgi:hypothetical protein
MQSGRFAIRSLDEAQASRFGRPGAETAILALAVVDAWFTTTWPAASDHIRTGDPTGSKLDRAA